MDYNIVLFDKNFETSKRLEIFRFLKEKFSPMRN